MPTVGLSNGLPTLLSQPIGSGEDLFVSPSQARSTVVLQLLDDGRVFVQAGETNHEDAFISGRALRPGGSLELASHGAYIRFGLNHG